MDQELIDTLDRYTEEHGEDIISDLRESTIEGWDLVETFEGLKEVDEDPEFHGEVTSFEHSVEVVSVLQELYSFIFKQQEESELDVEFLKDAIEALPKVDFLEDHLNRKVGNHTRKELLFFATIFHDIGKLKNFAYLAEEANKKNVRGVTRFIFHADYGSLCFESELEEIEDKIEHYEEKLEEEENPVKQDFYEKAKKYFEDLEEDFEKRENFFEKLQLGKEEREYISFLIEKHMDLLNFYKQFSEAYEEKGGKQLRNFEKNMLKKVKEYGDKYIDCIILNFCDLLESAKSVGKSTKELYEFLQACLVVFTNSDKLSDDAKLAFEEGTIIVKEPEHEYNVGALFKNLEKDEALKIKDIVVNSDDVVADLKGKGYKGKELGKIMKLLKS